MCFSEREKKKKIVTVGSFLSFRKDRGVKNLFEAFSSQVCDA